MYYVIEAHIDDAFLSLHSHMEEWIKSGNYVTIITVFTTPKLVEEAKKYTAALGARYRSLALTTGMHGLKGPRPKIPPFAQWGILTRPGDQLIFPLGIQHPDHLEVASKAPSLAWRYVDSPGQAKLKMGEEVQRLLQNKRIVSLKYPSKRKWRHIPIFQSQAKYFYYNPAESMYRIPEIVVRS